MRIPVLVIAAALPLAACVRVPPSSPPASTPRFDAIAFFDGHTEGTGTLTKLFAKPKATRVRSTGRMDGGTLIVDQVLIERSGPTTRRQWRVHETAPGRYEGTLSNSSGGAIVGEAVGNRLHFAFRMKGGLRIEQWLTLAPDGRSAHNDMTVTKMGMRVAALDEDIRKTE